MIIIMGQKYCLKAYPPIPKKGYKLKIILKRSCFSGKRIMIKIMGGDDPGK